MSDDSSGCSAVTVGILLAIVFPVTIIVLGFMLIVDPPIAIIPSCTSFCVGLIILFFAGLRRAGTSDRRDDSAAGER